MILFCLVLCVLSPATRTVSVDGTLHEFTTATIQGNRLTLVPPFRNGFE